MSTAATTRTEPTSNHTQARKASIQELRGQLEEGRDITLIDVRMPAEYREVHAAPAELHPLDALDAKALAAERSGSPEPTYVICKSGSRSKQAAERLAAAGLENVAWVDGGTEAWDQAGLPVERGRKTISLERQVRIAAGSLVFLGALLAMVVHPLIALLPLFVGGGLVFAGVTDTCGMAMLLARMPWNR